MKQQSVEFIIVVLAVLATSTAFVDATFGVDDRSSAAATSEQDDQVIRLHKLTDYPDAKCIDGTPAALYHIPASTNRSRTKWVFYLEGGGLCVNPVSCYLRSMTKYGSSSGYNETMPLSYFTGSKSRNCTLNPTFCDFNFVKVKYCDGFLFSGNLNGTISYLNHTMYLRGAAIRWAALDYIKRNLGFNQATDVLLSGCSGGALSTFLHMDTIEAWIRENIPTVQRVRALPLSGFFLSQPNAHYDEVTLKAFHGMVELSNATDAYSKQCLKGIPKQYKWVCTSAEMHFTYSKVPTFVVNSKTDAWQIPCLLLATEDPVLGENCNAIKPLSKCVDEGGEHGFAKCNATEMSPILWYQQAFLNRVFEVAGFRRNGAGSFISSCFTHCEGIFNDMWAGIAINNVTMQQAVTQWWETSDDTTPATENSHIDCQRPDTSPYKCNPTCPGYT